MEWFTLYVNTYRISNSIWCINEFTNQLRINILWPSDIIWWDKYWWALALVMACCLMAPSHYLNQCWLLISEVLWCSCHLRAISQHLPQILFCIMILKIILKKLLPCLPRGQWFKYNQAIWKTSWYHILLDHILHDPESIHYVKHIANDIDISNQIQHIIHNMQKCLEQAHVHFDSE